MKFHYKMLDEREKELTKKGTTRTKIKLFDPSFFAKLTTEFPGQKQSYYNYVKEFTTDLDVFSLEKIFIPIYTTFQVGWPMIDKHWSLMVVDMKNHKMYHYDPYKFSGNTKETEEDKSHRIRRELCCNALNMWFKDEAEHKEKIYEYIRCEEPDAYPKQDKRCDSGLFTILYADFLVDKAGDIPKAKLPRFEDDMIKFFRKRIAADILRGVIEN